MKGALAGWSVALLPDAVDHGGGRIPQQAAGRPGFLAELVEQVVDQDDIGRQLPDLVALGVEVGLRRIDQQAEHQSRDGRNQGAAQTDDVLGVSVQMMLRQYAA